MDIAFSPDSLFEDAGNILDQRNASRPLKPDERAKAVSSFVAMTALGLRPSLPAYVVSPEHYPAYITLVINAAAGFTDLEGGAADPLCREFARENLTVGRRPKKGSKANGTGGAGFSSESSQEGTRRPLAAIMAAAAPGIGELNLKLLNPKIEAVDGMIVVPNIPPGMANILKASSRPTSGNIATRVRLGYAGNAAYSAGAKILSARHRNLAGETRTILDLIVESPEAREVFLSLGMDRAVIDAIVGTASSSRDLSSVTRVDGSRMSVVYLPIGSGSYVQATPVSSNARYVELNNRIKLLGWRISSSRTKICNKPQLAGVVPLYEDGEIIRLHADFPRSASQDKWGFSLAAGRSPLSSRDISSDTAEAIVELSVLQEGKASFKGGGRGAYTNIDIRQGLQRRLSAAAEQCADALMESLSQLEALVAAGRCTLDRAPSYVRHLITPEEDSVEKARTDFVDDAVLAVRKAITESGRKLGREAEAQQAIGFTSSSLRTALQSVAEQVLA